jgi:UDP-GlcNAc:undecaprenyl-phosphate GlcNAc-1-phosphate transferase
MRTASLAFLSAAATAAALTPAVRTVARRWGAFDRALTSRKIHDRPVPRLGGLAIVAAFFAPLIALFFVDSDVGHRFYADPLKAGGLFVGGIAVAALGIYDDLRGLGAKEKFLVQFAVAAAMYAVGFRIDRIANPFGPELILGWMAIPFTMLWIAGVINAMNLIDGLDGLAGGVALIAVATTGAIALLNGQPLMLLFCAALGGAVLGFLFYNFNPASIFMGDTGSMFLGFVLAATSIQTNQKSSTTVAILVPIVALGVPIADTLLAMVRRAVRGVPMFSADRGHIHHRLLDSGLTHRQAVLVIYAACAVLGTSALVISSANSRQTAAFLLVVFVAVFMALRRLGFIDVKRVHRIVEARRHNVHVRRELRRIVDTMRAAVRVEDVWVGLQVSALTLGASAVALRPGEPDAAGDRYAEGFDVAGLELFRARYGLAPERLGDTYIELGWADGRTRVDRDTEIAIEYICEHLALALDRIAAEQEPERLVPAVNTGRR